MAMDVAYVAKYVTGSMISQEYSHQVSRAKNPNWSDMYAIPHQTTILVRRFERSAICSCWASRGAISALSCSNWPRSSNSFPNCGGRGGDAKSGYSFPNLHVTCRNARIPSPVVSLFMIPVLVKVSAQNMEQWLGF